MKTHTTSSHHQQGSSLLEVMISLFVLAIGLLGALAMQTQSMQHNQSSYAFMQSVYLASDIVERIRANPTGIYITPQTNLAGSAAVVCATTGCTVAQQKANDFFDLSRALVPLPLGKLEIALDAATKIYTISVYFDDTKNKLAIQGTTGGGEQTYKMQVRI